MQAAGMTEDYSIVACEQSPLQILELQIQMLIEMVRELCRRNRTRMTEGNRYETEGLWELDEEANTIAKE